MRKYTQNIQHGFTIIELLIVIGILGILAAITLVALDPLDQLVSAQDAQRRSAKREIQNAVYQYILDNPIGLPGIPTGIANTAPICTEGVTTDTTCINLDILVTQDYIAVLPVDPLENNASYSGFTIYEDQGGFIAVEAPYFGLTPEEATTLQAGSSSSSESGGSGETDIMAKSWGTPEVISSEDAYSGGPRIATDNSGKAMILWAQLSGGPYETFAAHYDSSWEEAVSLNSNVGGSAHPQVAMLNGSNTIGAWIDLNGTLAIQASTHDGSNWDTVSNIDNTTDHYNNIRLAHNDNGDAIIAWLETYSPGVIDVKVSHFNGTSWSTPTTINPSTQNIGAPELAIDSNGNAIITYPQLDGGTVYNLYASRYNGSIWDAPQVIDNQPTNAFYQEIVFDSNDIAHVVWSHIQDLYTATYNGSWSTPTMMFDGSENSQHPSLAVAGDDTIVAAWYYGGDTYAAWYNGSSWGAAEKLDIDIGGDTSDPYVTADANGNAIAIWPERDGSSEWDVYASVYRGGSWEAATALSSLSSDARWPQVQFDGNGDAIAAWAENDGGGSGDVYTVRFE